MKYNRKILNISMLMLWNAIGKCCSIVFKFNYNLYINVKISFWNLYIKYFHLNIKINVTLYKFNFN